MDSHNTIDTFHRKARPRHRMPAGEALLKSLENQVWRVAGGDVTFSMLVDAIDSDAALVRVIAVVVPAIRAVGGVLHLGQTVDPAAEASEVWRPRDLALT